MINYKLERSIGDHNNWEHYTSLGCDEGVAIELWHFWQEKQPNNQFRMYKVSKELVDLQGRKLDDPKFNSTHVGLRVTDKELVAMSESKVEVNNGND